LPEYMDVYDEHRNKTGRVWQRGVPMQPGDWRLVVYAWLFNEKGEVLLTQRHPEKTWPGYWECTAGGVQAGETSLQGALRELREEIGVVKQADEGILLQQALGDGVFIDFWLFRSDVSASDLVLQPTEVVDAKWVARKEYEKMCREGLLVPSCTDFYQWIQERKIQI
jgi:8-oxo-dGTP diphosphatase